MAITYNATLKSARMTDVVTALGSAAKLQIFDAGAVKLAELPLSNPAGTVTGAVLTFSGTPLTESSANASGTATNAKVVDGSGTVVISGLTVGSSGPVDITLSSTNIVAGQPFTITAASITHG